MNILPDYKKRKRSRFLSPPKATKNTKPKKDKSQNIENDIPMTSDDKKSYKSSIEKLMGDKEHCKKLGAQALINSSHYSSKHYAEKVLDVYNLALEGRNINIKRGFFRKAKDIFKRGFHGK